MQNYSFFSILSDKNAKFCPSYLIISIITTKDKIKIYPLLLKTPLAQYCYANSKN